MGDPLSVCNLPIKKEGEEGVGCKNQSMHGAGQI